MNIPLTKYGWPQVVVFPVIILTIMVVIALAGTNLLQIPFVIVLEIILALVLIWVLAFFRDPSRKCPLDENLLLSPADGKVTDIETIEENNPLGIPAIKIGIFLSIFNVHINRAPSNVKIKKITYKEGLYKNALDPESSKVNESNELLMVRTSSPTDKLIVKQISGAIARRIVCKTGPGDELKAGEKFGMIKFGSRTELYVPAHINNNNKNTENNNNIGRDVFQIKCLAKKGDKVKAGLTPLLRYEKCGD